jgi:hypothetical protein
MASVHVIALSHLVAVGLGLALVAKLTDLLAQYATDLEAQPA